MGQLITELINELALIGDLKSRFNPLVDYYKKNGSLSNILSSEMYEFNGEQIHLGSLISALRRQYKNGLLSQDEIKALESMGIVWKYDRFLPLQAYYEKYGTLALINGKETISVNGQQYAIGGLITSLRGEYRNNELSASDIAKLESMGMVWKHDRMFALRQYYNEFGTISNIKKSTMYEYAGKEINLNNIIVTIRADYKKGKLSNEEIAELNNMGIIWKVDTDIDEKLDIFKAYCKEFGSLSNITLNDTYMYNGENVKIGKKLYYLRKEYLKGNLSASTIRELEDMGMVWRVKNKRVSTLDVLNAYYNEFGTISTIQIRDQYEYNGQLVNIGSIVANLRRPERKALLSQEEIDKLNSMGFVWNALPTFDDRIAPLKAYYNEFGTIATITSDTTYEFNGNVVKIGSLLLSLRYLNNAGRLTAEQIVKLDELGINWNAKRVFDTKIEVLKAYYDQYGSIDQIASTDRFEYNGNEYPVGRHILELRVRYNEGKLSDNQIKALEELGIVWRKRNVKKTFDDKIEVLRQYTLQNNNTLSNVGIDETFNYNNEELDVSFLLTTFRQLYKSGELSESQVKALEDLGINWDGVDQKKVRTVERIYAVLSQYAKEHNGTIKNIKYKDIYVLNGEEFQVGEMVGRLRRNEYQLSQDQIDRFNQIGMLWYRSKFEYKMEVLQDYIQNKGPLSNVGLSEIYTYNKSNEPIGRWIRSLRVAYKNEKLSSERIEQLEAIGMVWNATFNKGVRLASR